MALRPLAPALLTAWLIVCVTAMHEVTMSSLLYGPGTETLAVVVLNSADLGQVQNTAALAVLVTLVVLVPALPVWLLVRRLRIRVPEPSMPAEPVLELDAVTVAYGQVTALHRVSLTVQPGR